MGWDGGGERGYWWSVRDHSWSENASRTDSAHKKTRIYKSRIRLERWRGSMPRLGSQVMSGRGIKPLSHQRLKFQPDVGRLCVLRGGDPMKFADIAAALPTNAVTSFDGLPFPKIASGKVREIFDLG